VLQFGWHVLLVTTDIQAHAAYEKDPERNPPASALYIPTARAGGGCGWLLCCQPLVQGQQMRVHWLHHCWQAGA
jgi:hypothetical protein